MQNLEIKLFIDDVDQKSAVSLGKMTKTRIQSYLLFRDGSDTNHKSKVGSMSAHIEVMSWFFY